MMLTVRKEKSKALSFFFVTHPSMSSVLVNYCFGFVSIIEERINSVLFLLHENYTKDLCYFPKVRKERLWSSAYNLLICILGGGALGHPKVYINLVRIFVESVCMFT